MQVMHPRCGGLDLGKDLLVACVRIHGSPVRREVRSFGTTTKELLALSDWLTAEGVTDVAMEATGSYWKSVWHVLEGSFDLLLANAGHIRNVPGRKSDVNDATWIADLLAHGLIRGSMVPPVFIQELRDLTRTRKQLAREVVQHTQRIQKVLDQANVKITGVISNVLGVSGRAILKALIAGETNPERLAKLLKGKLKLKHAQVVEALNGRVSPHHRGLLKLHLGLVENLEGAMGELDRQIGEALAPFRGLIERLDKMPGLSDVTAPAILAEVGLNMACFPSHHHLLSWACLCPRLDQSAGKINSTRTRKGAVWLKTMLVQAAWSAIKVKDSYLRAQFFRIKARRGPKKAILAVAASMLTAIYYMIRDGVEYRDLGAAHFDNADRVKATNRLIRRLEGLGYRVHLEPAA
jgi:transposase